MMTLDEWNAEEAIREELEAELSAERDAARRQRDAYYEELKEVKAKLDAVPVEAIALYWETTFVDYGRIAHEDHMKVAKADEAVENWIAEVKYGKRGVTK